MSTFAFQSSSSSSSGSSSSAVSMQPCRGNLAGDGRLPMAERRGGEEEEDEEEGSCSSSSSIGRNSDDESDEDCGETEVESSFKGPLDTMDALAEVLPIKAYKLTLQRSENSVITKEALAEKTGPLEKDCDKGTREISQSHLRQLYSVLVMFLWRDPIESLQVMAFWIWLERMGCTNLVDKILSLPSTLISEIANEAFLVLNCIKHDQFAFSPENTDMPLTKSLTARDLSLKPFHDDRVGVSEGVAKVRNDVCLRALTDIMQAAIDRNATQSLIDTQAMVGDNQPQYIPEMPPQTNNCLNMFGSHGLTPQPAYGHNTFEHPHAGYSHGMLGSEEIAPAQEPVPQPPHQAQPPENQVPVGDDRTMFATFSRGYHVWEWELRQFLAKNFGDCIESLEMQDVRPNEQSLFATVVFRSPETMHLILRGMEKAKFTINGKHVWVRKYVPKPPRFSRQPSSEGP